MVFFMEMILSSGPLECTEESLWSCSARFSVGAAWRATAVCHPTRTTTTSSDAPSIVRNCRYWKTELLDPRPDAPRRALRCAGRLDEFQLALTLALFRRRRNGREQAGRLACIADDGRLRFGRPTNAESIAMRRQIQKVIDEEINPMIASHGGQIDLVDFVDKNIYIEMSGGCQGCAASTATLRQGVERILRETFGDDVNQIIDVTDHNAGDNPYYA